MVVVGDNSTGNVNKKLFVKRSCTEAMLKVRHTRRRITHGMSLLWQLFCVLLKQGIACVNVCGASAVPLMYLDIKRCMGMCSATLHSQKKPQHLSWMRCKVPCLSCPLCHVMNHLQVLQHEIRKTHARNQKVEWVDDLVLMETIGKGGFGVVYKGSWKGSLAAIKVGMEPGGTCGRGCLVNRQCLLMFTLLLLSKGAPFKACKCAAWQLLVHVAARNRPSSVVC